MITLIFAFAAGYPFLVSDKEKKWRDQGETFM